MKSRSPNPELKLRVTHILHYLFSKRSSTMVSNLLLMCNFVQRVSRQFTRWLLECTSNLYAGATLRPWDLVTPSGPCWCFEAVRFSKATFLRSTQGGDFCRLVRTDGTRLLYGCPGNFCEIGLSGCYSRARVYLLPTYSCCTRDIDSMRSAFLSRETSSNMIFCESDSGSGPSLRVHRNRDIAQASGRASHRSWAAC